MKTCIPTMFSSTISPWEMLSSHYSSMSFKTTDKVEQKRDLLLMQNVRRRLFRRRWSVNESEKELKRVRVRMKIVCITLGCHNNVFTRRTLTDRCQSFVTQYLALNYKTYHMPLFCNCKKHNSNSLEK